MTGQLPRLNLPQLTELTVAPSLLTLCLQVTDAGQQHEQAVLVTEQGLWVASLALYQQPSMASNNLLLLAPLHGVAIRSFAQASAAHIRQLLHDADSATSQPQAPLQLDHTRAQQALEDLLQQGVQLGASDIHLQFDRAQASVAFRVHGRMVARAQRSREMLVAAVAAALNTRSDDFHELFDEQRLSSASINLSLMSGGQPQQFRLRVQKSPTRNGFAVTMRIQDQSAQVRQLSELGLPNATLKRLQQVLQQSAGMIVVAGPTGQGKSTTLAAINLALPAHYKIISLEDPIEIIQPHIEQKPVLAEHPELNFANMVKVALREDPDVISISEIRDQATAKAAYTAALTGHLVTATVHAHDTFGALQRLLDLGLEAQALAQPGVLHAVIAQRLRLLLCEVCNGDGCDACQQLGSRGRQLQLELLVVDAAVRRALREQRLSEARQQLLDNGWQTLAALTPQELITCD